MAKLRRLIVLTMSFSCGMMVYLLVFVFLANGRAFRQREDTLMDHLLLERNTAHMQMGNKEGGHSLAEKLYDQVRVVCLVMTYRQNHRRKADHVAATWGKRCNHIVFVTDANDTSLPALISDAEPGREHLTRKTMQGFDHLFKFYGKEGDWFMKADDDTYVIVENLRYFLSEKNSSDPVFFGHHFVTNVKQGYFSGGGGYVISKEALHRFGHRTTGQCQDDGPKEDVYFGRCMETLGVRTGFSLDSQNRSRFNCFEPQRFVFGNFPRWYSHYDKYGAKKGLTNVSDYVISFHYVHPKVMHTLEYLIYGQKVYGTEFNLTDRM